MARTTKSWTLACRPRSWNVRRMNRAVRCCLIPAALAIFRIGLSRQDPALNPPVSDGNNRSESPCDFFILVTARFRVLYVFVVLSLGRRTIVHAGVTDHPSASWAAQRIAEATSDVLQVPRFLVHDRDSIYGSDFRRRVRGLGTRLLATPPRAPTANAFGERVIGTLRRGCFDHIIVRDKQHAERVLRDYLAYYHGRPHRGLRMQPPDGARHLPPPCPPKGTPIDGIPILGGLHHRYGFAVAARAPPSAEPRPD
jgi:transposase InsO family protein